MNLSTRWCAPALAAIVALASAPTAQTPAPERRPSPERTPAADKAPPVGRAEYAAANAQEKALRGTKGVARRTAQLAAADSFAKIADLDGVAPDLAGRALLKAARLLERAKDRERSVACIERALALATAPRTRANALNLRGHAFRRAEKFPAAIDDYGLVAKKHAEVASALVVALRWLGTCKERIGDHAGARAAWDERAKRFAQRTRVVVESRDLIACSFLREGKVADARSVLDACRAQFAEAAKAPGKRGRSVRRALASMRIVKRLARLDAQQEPDPAP